MRKAMATKRWELRAYFLLNLSSTILCLTSLSIDLTSLARFRLHSLARAAGSFFSAGAAFAEPNKKFMLRGYLDEYRYDCREVFKPGCTFIRAPKKRSSQHHHKLEVTFRELTFSGWKGPLVHLSVLMIVQYAEAMHRTGSLKDQKQVQPRRTKND